MFQKFGKDVPQSLVDAVAEIMGEAKVEPAAPDREAIERRKRLQALKDKQEDERAAKADRESDPLSSDYKEKKSSGVTVRTHTAKHKPEDDVNEEVEELDEAGEYDAQNRSRGRAMANSLSKSLADKSKEPKRGLVDKLTGGRVKVKTDTDPQTGNKFTNVTLAKKKDGSSTRPVGKEVQVGKRRIGLSVQEEVEYLEFVEAVYEMNEEQLDDMINEVLGKDASAGDWISDFTKSDNPKFAGKSKAQRKKMALAAYYAKQRNEEVEDVEEELKGNQHKIDANKNGKVDAHDFKLLRAKKKVNEEEVDLDEGIRGDVRRKMQRSVNRIDKLLVKSEPKIGKTRPAYKDRETIRKFAGSLSDTSASDTLNAINKAKRKVNEEEKDNKQDEYTHKVVHVKTGNVVGKYKSLKAASRAVDRKDNAYGGYAHTIQRIDEDSEIEESRGHTIIAKKLAQIARRNPLPQSDKLKDAENLKQVEIVKQKDTSVSHPQDNLDVHDQHYDLNKKSHGYGKVHSEEVEKKDDVPFDGSKPKDNVVVGKKGKGHAKASALAKMGLKKYLKNETMMGKAGTTSEEFQVGDRVVASGMTGKKTGTVKKVVKMDNGNGYLVKHDNSKLDLNYPAHKLAKEEVELDEGTHVVHTKEVGKGSTDKDGPKISIKADNDKHAWQVGQQKVDKMGGHYIDKIEPIKEQMELDETAVLDKYIRSLGYDPEKLEKNKKVMFSKTNAYKKFQTQSEAMYDGGQKGTQDIDTHMSPGATARG